MSGGVSGGGGEGGGGEGGGGEGEGGGGGGGDGRVALLPLQVQRNWARRSMLHICTLAGRTITVGFWARATSGRE